MPRLIMIGLCFVCLFITMKGKPVDFDTFFFNQTLRVDYYHIGHAQMDVIAIDQMKRYEGWAGSCKNLTDEFNNGRYYARVFDDASGELLFSRGYDCYFAEYQSSDDGVAGKTKVYHESVLVPYPRQKIRLVIERRDQQQQLNKIFEQIIDPGDWRVIREETHDPQCYIEKIVNNGDPHRHVDLVVVADGYTNRELSKFKQDMQRFNDYFFSLEPYRSMRDEFNVTGVLKPSVESGCDEPESDIYKQTALNCTFNSLGSERYLLTEDNRSLRDIAGQVPYDAILVMVNHSRYGGGGIYNSFCTFTSDNQWVDYLILHEFGHSFGGLADEYYTSETAYNDFYPKGIEPVEPNITALLGDTVKWQNVMSAGLAIPTPWEKSAFDSMDGEWQQRRREMNRRISDLKRARAPESEIKAAITLYDQTDQENSQRVIQFLEKCQYAGKVGVFEGAGYSSQGLYRPMLDCIMFSKGKKPYCQICQHHIEKVIRHYTE